MNRTASLRKWIPQYKANLALAGPVVLSQIGQVIVQLSDNLMVARLGALPLAAVNSGVLGTVLVERTQSFTLEQSMGFGLGSGLGYLLAVMLVTEADRRLRSEAIPEAFRGLPITLVYVGVLALAIYGFTGHSVIL